MEILYCDRCKKIIKDDDKNSKTGINISFIDSDETGEWIVNDYFDLCGACFEKYTKTREKLQAIINKKRCEVECKIRSIEANTFTIFLKHGNEKG